MNYDRVAHLGFIMEAINRTKEAFSNCKKLALMLFFTSSLLPNIITTNVTFNDKIISFLTIVIIWIICVLWYLDAGYMRQEQLYFKLYDAVRLDEGNLISPYDMSLSSFEREVDSVLHIMRSSNIRYIYIPLFSTVFYIIKVLHNTEL